MKTKEELLISFIESERIIQKLDIEINKIESEKDFASDIVKLARFVILLDKKLIAIHMQVLAIYQALYEDKQLKII